MADSEDLALSCPIPIHNYPQVLLAHGGGGRLMQQLIAHTIAPALCNPEQETEHDGAVLPLEAGRLVFTTDSYVVQPLFFPGGDIGSLAVHGTVNDLAMCGARPLYLSAGLIIEEGLPIETLRRVVQSMGQAALAAGVRIVTGDTKVVERGKGDGLFINTAGIGLRESVNPIGPRQIRSGDRIVLNGDLGRHGMAIMAEREGLAFESRIESDSAPLAEPVLALLAAGVEVHCLRDLTRGGLASALVEIASVSGAALEIREQSIPVREDVQGACEILGLDPLYVANEGRFVAFIPEKDVESALAVLNGCTPKQAAVCIGEVVAPTGGEVTIQSSLGARRVIDLLSGEQLPRIC